MKRFLFLAVLILGFASAAISQPFVYPTQNPHLFDNNWAIADSAIIHGSADHGSALTYATRDTFEFFDLAHRRCKINYAVFFATGIGSGTRVRFVFQPVTGLGLSDSCETHLNRINRPGWQDSTTFTTPQFSTTGFLLPSLFFAEPLDRIIVRNLSTPEERPASIFGWFALQKN